MVIRCTTCCQSLYHTLSFVVTRCNSLSLVVPRCNTRLSFYKRLSKFLKLIKFITQSYLSLLSSFLLLILSTFSVFLKSLSDYFFSWLGYKSLLNRFSVLINYTVLCGLPFFFLHMVQVF